MIRLAGIDPKRAAEMLDGRLADALGETDRQYLWGRVALESARRHEPEALAWYERAGHDTLTYEEREWKA